MQIIPFNQLAEADLIIDATYEGRRNGNAGDDPLPTILGVSNQGGFRILGSREAPRLVVLTTSMDDPEWPDILDHETGVFTYFGDNKKPGRELHGTPRYGNLLLRNMFDALHTGRLHAIPPILIFAGGERYRDVVFKGLVVPGVAGLSPLDDLVAIWKTTGGMRFQNYQAKFTMLDIQKLPRSWLSSLQANRDWLSNAPSAWLEWRATGRARPLKAIRSLEIRSRDEQLPSGADANLLRLILDRFSAYPHAFEMCAAEIVRMFLGENVMSIDLTRPVRDGGRDGVGRYLIGRGTSSIAVDFSMEAKCYRPPNSVGVKELSRLISRLRHRQFGVLVTTSWVNNQAYKEIKEDGHPILVIAGSDIVRILKEKGISSRDTLNSWLDMIGDRAT
ncbi:restriction endonuclease [Sinorhizobium medicae]|nr:restriction endonuclease [Sinorhizobium medicae]